MISFDDLAHAYRRGVEEAQGMRDIPEETTDLERTARALGLREGLASRREEAAQSDKG